MGESNRPLTVVTPQVTRVEVIDGTGRAFVGYYRAGEVSTQLQDNESTLKIFGGYPLKSDEWSARR